jgi:hypothetical protein
MEEEVEVEMEMEELIRICSEVQPIVDHHEHQGQEMDVVVLVLRKLIKI